jgi:glucose/arabinose dehydrogenase
MTNPRRTNRAAIALAITAAISTSWLTACSDDADEATPSSTQATSAPEAGEPPTAELPALQGVVAATGTEPIVLITRPGDDGHVWVAERAGQVQRYEVRASGAELVAVGEPAIDISDRVTTQAERGLLGMAFSPDGETLLLSYSDPQGDTAIEAYPMDGDVAVDDPTLLFGVGQPYPNHNGGGIAMGPDGKLWLGLGDGGAADDPENRAQDPDTELGKMIRIDVETTEVEIVVSGVRNPWRWAFDEDGSLWIADVGQNATEEINRLPAGEIDGANLGWSGYEGSAPYLDGEGRRPDDAVAPVFEYGRDGGNCSITGGFVYRGTAIVGLDGAFLFADFCAGRVRAVVLDDAGRFARELDLGIDVASPISFGHDQTGEPYVLSAGGGIVRIMPETP